MIKINVPEPARKIIYGINQAGFEAYVVGGCVRDSLMGRCPHDWDITTSARPEDVKAIFKKTIDTGIKHGTVTVLMDGEQIEVTTYRIDGEYTDGRHPSDVEFTNLLSEDLKRRDFTINAMAYHPELGVVDLFGGQQDLADGIIRCVGEAKERFTEDALRMMRAIRFAAVLGFEIEVNTWNAIKELSETLSRISAERIREEMLKLLVSDNPDKFRLFYEAGLTKIFMPEFDKCMETPQVHIHHCYGVGEHILHAVSNVRNEKVLRLAMLFHDIAKPKMLSISDDGVTHFYGHPLESGKMARTIMQRLRFDNATIADVVVLAEYHDRNIELNEKAMRRIMNKIGSEKIPLLLEVKTADVLAQSNYQREEKLATIKELEIIYRLVCEKNHCVSLSDLAVNGKDIIDLGVKPGKEIGEVLGRMLDDVIDEPTHNNRSYLIETYVKIITLFLCIGLFLTGCAPVANGSTSLNSTGYNLALPGSYDSADTAVIMKIKQEEGTIQFKTLHDGRLYTLNYDGATTMYDKYGTAVSLAQLSEGNIVDITFMKGVKRLNSMQLSADYFMLTDIKSFETHAGGYKLKTDTDDYYLSDMLVVTGPNGECELMDINAVDTLILQGKDHTIYSIIISTGHGYLRLENSEYFVDGWIEIGQNLIYKITEDMLLAVPAGQVNITVSKSGSVGTQSMYIYAGEEYTLDVSQWQDEVQTGKILFTTTPSNALVYIDGEEVDTSIAVELDYGIHQMMVMAEGYTTVNKYIRVASASANLDVTLEKETESSVSDNSAGQNTVSGNTVSGNTVSDNNAGNGDTNTEPSDANNTGSVSNNNAGQDTGSSVSGNSVSSNQPGSGDIVNVSDKKKVTIESPDGAEVYVDGSYVGLVPISFDKVSGTIVITLRKNGYQTRSYTLTISDDDEDVNYSFSELIPISG